MTGLHGSMPDWLHERARLSPGATAVVAGKTAVSFAALEARAAALANRLRAEGVRRGKIVAVLAANGLPFAEAVHAVPRAGGVLMPLNLRLADAELAWQLRDAGAGLLLSDAANADRAARLARETAETACILLEDGGQGEAASEAPPPFDLAAVHSVVYTSGTSGKPKGAQLTYGNHLWSATASALNLGIRRDDRWLACLPLFHVGGLAILLRSAIYGIPALLHEAFDPARVNRAIDEEGVTIVSVVANMLQRMLDERGGRPFPASLRCILLGGGPAPEPLLRRCAAVNAPAVQTYGLTEAASQVSTLSPEDALRKPGSAGKPLFGTELRILDEAGRDCPPGVAGEIAVRGPTVTPGYLDDPAATAAALRDGWLHTGDAGYVDPEGYLYVLDRRDDLIVSGGENVYPAEVEAVLASHPEVAEAGVFAVDDERWGRAPAAAVVLRPGAAVTAEALIGFCRERLARYKAPVRVHVVQALPRNASGKLLRRELREQLGS